MTRTKQPRHTGRDTWPDPDTCRWVIEQTDMFQWVIEQYDALAPDGQLAINKCLIALPRRPASERAIRPGALQFKEGALRYDR